jgi:hypothetical protein
MLGWHRNANPLMDPTPNKSKADKLLKLRKPLSMLSLLKGIEIISVSVEAIRAPIATVVSLKTYFRSGKKLSAANTPKKINLKSC